MVRAATPGALTAIVLVLVVVLVLDRPGSGASSVARVDIENLP
jgi:hypothetical protein